MKQLRIKQKISWAIITSLYFFPMFLSSVIFATYCGTGHTLGIAMAFSVLTVLNLIKEPIRSLPLFIGQLMEFAVAMTRI